MQNILLQCGLHREECNSKLLKEFSEISLDLLCIILIFSYKERCLLLDIFLCHRREIYDLKMLLKSIYIPACDGVADIVTPAVHNVSLRSNNNGIRMQANILRFKSTNNILPIELFICETLYLVILDQHNHFILLVYSLKRHNQTKIIKKSVILFLLLHMTI